MPKYQVWIGFQGSTYTIIEAESAEQAKQLAEEDADRLSLSIPFDYFVGNPEEIVE